MKELILAFQVIFVITIMSSKLFAQNPIPSFNVPVIIDPTTFEEVQNRNLTTTYVKSEPLSQRPVSRGEKDLVIKAKDNNTSTTAWVVVEIYSLDGNNIYGPYTVYEDVPFIITLNYELDWGVYVQDASYDCKMDVYFD